jgi:hypothetical protein
VRYGSTERLELDDDSEDDIVASFTGDDGGSLGGC